MDTIIEAGRMNGRTAALCFLHYTRVEDDKDGFPVFHVTVPRKSYNNFINWHEYFKPLSWALADTQQKRNAAWGNPRTGELISKINVLFHIQGEENHVGHLVYHKDGTMAWYTAFDKVKPFTRCKNNKGSVKLFIEETFKKFVADLKTKVS